MGVFSASGCCDDADAAGVSAAYVALGTPFTSASVTQTPAPIAITDLGFSPGDTNSGFTDSLGNLTYTATETALFHVTASISGTWQTTDEMTGFIVILKNGTTVDINTAGRQDFDNAAGGSVRTAHTDCIVELATGDNVRIGFMRGTGSDQTFSVTAARLVVAQV